MHGQVTVSKLGTADRIDTMYRRDPFITLKTIKTILRIAYLLCTLINPAESEMGRVSKRVLMLWNNSAAVIE